MTRTLPVAPVRWTLQTEQLAAWAAACTSTGEAPAPAVLGAPAPPMAVVLGTVPHVATPLLRALQAEQPAEPATTLLHGDEEVLWHLPLLLGEPYLATGHISAQGRSAAGFAVRLLAQLHRPDGALVATTASSLFFVAGDRAPKVPAARVPAAPAPRPTWATWKVASDQPERYARASGDDNPLHLDDARAQSFGLLRRPLHGMCTLAFAARGLSAGPDPGLPRTLRRLRARFRAPVYPGDVLRLQVEPADPGEGVRFVVLNQADQAVLARGSADFAR